MKKELEDLIEKEEGARRPVIERRGSKKTC